MAIIKWEPFVDIDKFFEDLPSLPFPKIGWDLAADLYEEGDNIIVEMCLPGINGEKVDVSVEDNYLRVSGSREEKKEEKRKHYYSKEIRRGSFERMVHLPDAVKKDKVKAEYKDGVLRVVLPKSSKAKANKVKVSVKK